MKPRRNYAEPRAPLIDNSPRRSISSTHAIEPPADELVAGLDGPQTPLKRRAVGENANIIMVWNTVQMRRAFDHWARRRSGAVRSEPIGRLAPTRTERINPRGIFRFPVEQYVEKILPSVALEKATGGGP